MDTRTALVLSDSSWAHDTGPGHPEHAGRLGPLTTAWQGLLEHHPDRVERRSFPSATVEDVAAVHDPRLIELVREAVDLATARDVLVGLDADTRVSPGSWTAALDGSGAAIAAVDAVSSGSVRSAFVAARPPGHHATPTRAMGFCLFNHVAVAARWLQRTGRAERVLIVDWDVHHGNGTQDAFYTDSSVCYVSTHQWPHYPGTGARAETGEGDGRGFTFNVPLPAGLEPDAWLERFEEEMDRVDRVFTPDFVLVSAGFDVLAGDPLGGMQLEPPDLAAVTRSLLARADRWCDGRVTHLLEGGYVPDRLADGAVAVTRAMLDLDA